MVEDIPLLKEYRLEKIIESLHCIDKFSLNRKEQKNCIYTNYRVRYKKSIESFDKAIFRGMVIPSLRYLGFIAGYGDFIKISSNGKLILQSNILNENLKNKALQALIFEIDQKVYHFLHHIENSEPLTTSQFVDSYYNNVPIISEIISKKQKEERVSKWLSILEQVQLLSSINNLISINRDKLESTKQILDVKHIGFQKFEKVVKESYSRIGANSAGIVEIEELRLTVAITFLIEYKKILTEQMFDILFTKLIENPEGRIYSLGRPMGKQEKLFKFRENYYKTIIIKKIRGEP